MSWAEASYYLQQFSSNLNYFDKMAVSAYAFATAQDHVHTPEDLPDSFEGGGGGDGGGRHRRCRTKHIREHTPDSLAKPADVKCNRESLKSGMIRTRGPSQHCGNAWNL